MPEAAEVEVLRRELLGIVGKEILEVLLTDDNPRFRQAGGSEGCLVLDITRRGKYLLVHLEDASGVRHEMVVHLGMTGVLSLGAAGEGPSRRRVLWRLSEGIELTLGDVRGFGRVALVPPGSYASVSGLQGLGPEPLDSFDVEAFARSASGSGRTIKTRLLGQDLMAGVGNYVADEGLWYARVHPTTNLLGLESARDLARALVSVVQAGVERGGLSMKDYVHSDGSAGAMGEALACYGRAGLPCLRCGTTLVRSVVGGRGSTWCPTCQVPVLRRSGRPDRRRSTGT